ncbi:MAG: PDDEXK nuclease domain-containing protein [Deltaproteobacteria bacterium]|jgi:predicted nuclease of restriction endonuclease-like (RecB) superfamily|nr:PDDEXK nuclease domain-containing protein [Deltaproteobacteria bacterium]
MNTNEPTLMRPEGKNLFDRVVSILEQARSNVVRAVNNNMVIAYWLIGREVVQQIQGGDERAEYGKQIIEQLSAELNNKYGRGFSTTNLRYFRTFHTTYSDRIPEIRHIGGGEFKATGNRHTQSGVLAAMGMAVKQIGIKRGFSPNLGWSHYRALMNVEHQNERLFYEIEAEAEGWEVKHLERQIHTFLFARILKSRDKRIVLELACQGQRINTPADTIKNPYILDFLGLPDSRVHHESEIEKAIIDNLQLFLLELGKGFAFVGRQKRMQFDDDYFYIDLVFYNCILKCYLLIDLKIGELAHQDVGQMDSYIRMFDDKYIAEGDNPTIGLILCAKKNKTIARYSVLNDSKQLFASKYMLYLPTEEELRRELERERRLIEEAQSEGEGSDQAS